MGGSRAAQTRDSKEGRGCEHHPAQEAAVEHSGTRHSDDGCQLVRAVGRTGFMKSPYLSDLRPNQVFTTTFLVHVKDVRQKKSGEPYLSLLLGDRTGEVDA